MIAALAESEIVRFAWEVGAFTAALVVADLAVGLQVLLHELGHAVAHWCVGGKVLEIEIGRGARVWSKRFGGVRLTVRPRWRRGRVIGCVRGTHFWRLRRAIVMLAGPAVSLALLVLALVFFAPVVRDWREVPRPMYWFGMTALTSFLLQVITTFFVTRVRHPEREVVGDLLVVWMLVRLEKGLVAQTALAGETECRYLENFERFLGGDPAGASKADRELPDFADVLQGRFMSALVYEWAMRGPSAALEGLDRVEEELAACSAAHQEVVDALRRVCDCNRVFFATESGSPAALEAAAPALARLRGRTDPLVAERRVLGLYDLHRGDLGAAAQQLDAAWRCEEPFFLRAITALGLALLHARQGKARPARRLLAKAARLHPTAPMLLRYRELVENALAGRAAVA